MEEDTTSRTSLLRTSQKRGLKKEEIHWVDELLLVAGVLGWQLWGEHTVIHQGGTASFPHKSLIQGHLIRGWSLWFTDLDYRVASLNSTLSSSTWTAQLWQYVPSPIWEFSLDQRWQRDVCSVPWGKQGSLWGQRWTRSTHTQVWNENTLQFFKRQWWMVIKFNGN